MGGLSGCTFIFTLVLRISLLQNTCLSANLDIPGTELRFCKIQNFLISCQKRFFSPKKKSKSLFFSLKCSSFTTKLSTENWFQNQTIVNKIHASKRFLYGTGMGVVLSKFWAVYMYFWYYQATRMFRFWPLAFLSYGLMVTYWTKRTQRTIVCAQLIVFKYNLVDSVGPPYFEYMHFQRLT